MFKTLEEKSPNVFLLSEEKKSPDKANLIPLVIGILGSLLVFIGNFLPIVNWAKIDSSGTFIKAFPVFGWLFISLAILSFIILVVSKRFLLVFVGILALLLLAYLYHQNQTERDKQIETGEDNYWTSTFFTSGSYDERLKAAKLFAKVSRDINFSFIAKESHWVWTSLFTGCLLLVVSGMISNNGLRKWFVKNFALYEPKKR